MCLKNNKKYHLYRPLQTTHCTTHTAQMFVRYLGTFIDRIRVIYLLACILLGGREIK